jgi:hypothetical protein
MNLNTETTLTIEVWSLHISHKHGDDVTVHASEDAANEALLGYVRDYWEQEDVPGVMPDERDAAIRAYFDHVEGESADLKPHIVADAVLAARHDAVPPGPNA